MNMSNARRTNMKKQLIIAFATMLAAALATPAHALWNVTVQQEGASPGGNIVGGTVDNIGEAETLLAGGGPAEGTGSPPPINYTTAFPRVAARGGDPPHH